MLKRVREESVWPDVFSIRGLASMIIDFLPVLQCRQWILESDETTVYNLCLWSARCLADVEVKRHIVVTSNERALALALPHFQDSDWRMLSCEARAETLRFALSKSDKKPNLYLLTLPCRHISVLYEMFGFRPHLQSCLIFDAFVDGNVAMLDWFFNTLGCSYVISERFPWTDELCHVVKPSVVAGRVSFSDIFYIPPQLLVGQISTLSVQSRRDLFHEHRHNIAVAAMLWLPDIDVNQCFDCSVMEEYAKIPGLYSWTPKWSHKHTVQKTTLQPCEDALCFLATSTANLAFNEVLLQCLMHFLFTDHQQRIWIFALCCYFGLPNMAQKIWACSDQATKSELSPFFKIPKCTNVEMIQFMFDRVDNPCQTLDRWQDIAWRTNNIELWSFVLNVAMFDASPMMEHTSQKLVHLGNKPVEFVALLWPKFQQTLCFVADILFTSAMRYQNPPLLRFLFLQDGFVVNNQLLCENIVKLSQWGVLAAIRQIKDPQSIADYIRCLAFVVATDVHVTHTLFMTFEKVPPNTNTLIKALAKLSFNEQRHLDLCKFFIEHKLVTLCVLYDTCFKDKPQTPLMDAFIASFYADI